MKLQNSYIFIHNPYKEESKENKQAQKGKIVVDIAKGVCKYIEQAFPSLREKDARTINLKRAYSGSIEIDGVVFQVEMQSVNIDGITYLNIFVEGKRKSQIIKCLEHIQNTLFDTQLREKYVEIVSYDSISEFYCNKLYPKLNELERNLRKLFFNVYVLNLGEEYYKYIEIDGLTKKVKEQIGRDNKERSREIRKRYNVSDEKAKEIDRIQQFFYSLEMGDIKLLLFEKYWSRVDEEKKEEFLSKHDDLSVLSDEELRSMYKELTPKSDWERYFSGKIEMENIEIILDDIRCFRNSVAHCKFLNRKKFDECNNKIKKLNTAIEKAIIMTETQDHTKKIKKALEYSLSRIADISHSLLGSFDFGGLKSVLAYAGKMMEGLPKINGIVSSLSLMARNYQSSQPWKIESPIGGDIVSAGTILNDSNSLLKSATENTAASLIAKEIAKRNAVLGLDEHSNDDMEETDFDD